MNENELNEEYISLISQMRELNRKRVEVYKKFKIFQPNVENIIEYIIESMRTPSIYHDLYGNDLDKN